MKVVEAGGVVEGDHDRASIGSTATLRSTSGYFDDFSPAEVLCSVCSEATAAVRALWCHRCGYYVCEGCIDAARQCPKCLEVQTYLKREREKMIMTTIQFSPSFLIVLFLPGREASRITASAEKVAERTTEVLHLQTKEEEEEEDEASSRRRASGLCPPRRGRVTTCSWRTGRGTCKRRKKRTFTRQSTRSPRTYHSTYHFNSSALLIFSSAKFVNMDKMLCTT